MSHATSASSHFQVGPVSEVGAGEIVGLLAREGSNSAAP
jgi:hypothetical protein